MYKNLFFLIIVLSITAATNAHAQKYPMLIPSGTEQLISASADSLWILSNNQFNNALADSKELKIMKQELSTHQEISELYKKKSAQQDSLITTLEKDRNFYMNTWKTCDADLEKMVKTTKKQKTYTRIALVSIPVAFLVGLFVN